jgi:hypothetical protein
MSGVANETARFLGQTYDWGRAALRLHDVQPLHGGVVVELPGFGMGTAYVTVVGRDGRETRYRLLLDIREKLELLQLCVDVNLLALQSSTRLGIPDEARPTITLQQPRRGESFQVRQWEGEMTAEFAELVGRLRELATRKEKLQRIRQKLPPPVYGLVLTAALLVLLLPALPAYWLGERAAALFWPTRPGLALLLLLLGNGLVLGGLRLLARRERHKSRHDKVFRSMLLLGLLNLAQLLIIISAWELAAAWWQSIRSTEPLLADGARRGYIVAGYAALTAMPLQMLIAGAAGKVVSGGAG